MQGIRYYAYTREMGAASEWQLIAGQRPSNSAAATSLVRLHLSLLGDFQRVVDLNPKVADGALDLRVTQE